MVKGGVERIGNSPSAFTHAVPGKPTREGEIDAPTHTAAIAHAMELITDPEVGCFEDLGQLGGIGFKTILARGYWRSARITEDVIDALENIHTARPDAQSCIYRLYPRLSRTPPDDTARCCL